MIFRWFATLCYLSFKNNEQNGMFSLNCKGRLLIVDKPLVMGIMNITPDSFYSGSRIMSVDDVLHRAEKMLNEMCISPIIEKERYRILHEGFIWEVDEFLGANAGLVVAEIEVKSEEEAFERPSWVSLEVTGDPRYLNSNLAKQPFNTWNK